MSLFIVIIIPVAVIYSPRPDISNAVTSLIYQKCQYTLTTLGDGIATAYNLLQRLSVNILQPVGRLASFPWMEYYNRGQGLIDGLISWAAFLG